MSMNVENTTLVLVDMQEKLINGGMYRKDKMLKKQELMLKSAKELGLSIIVTEQYTDGLGYTIDKFQELIENCPIVEKTTFSCCGEPVFNKTLAKKRNENILLIGIEAHICIQQTALDLLEKGYSVYVLTDAVTSRAKNDKEVATAYMQSKGINIITVEAVIFELLKDSKHLSFKEISTFVKQ